MPGIASARAPSACWHSAGLAVTASASGRRGNGKQTWPGLFFFTVAFAVR